MRGIKNNQFNLTGRQIHFFEGNGRDKNRNDQSNERSDGNGRKNNFDDIRPSGFLAKAHQASTRKVKTSDTCLDCGANNYFFWDQKAFESFESQHSSSVDTCNGSAQILGQGQVTFHFTNSIVTLLCKRAPEFDQNVISLPKIIEKYHV